MATLKKTVTKVKTDSVSAIDKFTLVRNTILNDLEAFINVVAPQRLLGSVHREIASWLTSVKTKTHKLLLIPRGHQKSALVAYYAAWQIIRNPTITILYVSSTTGLAEKQLKMIKDILESTKIRQYFPELINPEENKREKWTASEICVDHPRRKEEGIRDSTVFTAGLTTNIVGLHCDLIILDDVVTGDNAYTKEGRDRVESQFSLLSSILNAGGEQVVAGTHYHPCDLYSRMKTIVEDVYNKDGEPIDTRNVYDTFQRQVETNGDGSGQFLWQRMKRESDGKWFGFNQQELAKIRATYIDKTQFRAQYYNDPNDKDSAKLNYGSFEYYDPSLLKYKGMNWYYAGHKLNIVASIDFAYSIGQRSDYTALVVVGVDEESTYYILDIERFKTQRIADYFDRILRLHNKWFFRRLIAEVTGAQQAIVRDLKENYIRKESLALSVTEYRPTKHEGTKEERISAILDAKYDNKQVLHYRAGNCQLLEEELVQAHPAHDDIKDAVATAIDNLHAPTMASGYGNNSSNNVLMFNKRFGGVA